MTVGGFASLRELVRRVARQLNGVPNDVLVALENQLRVHHELLLDAWDEMKHRGAAVNRVANHEYERARQLVNEVLQAEGERVATLWRDQNAVARGLIEMIAQEVTAYHEEQR